MRQILFHPNSYKMWAGTAQTVSPLAMGWTVRGSNTGGGEIFHSRADRPKAPPKPLHSGYRISFPEVKRRRRGVNHKPPFSADVKEKVDLYLYSPSGLSWPVLGWNLPYNLLYIHTYTLYYRQYNIPFVPNMKKVPSYSEVTTALLGFVAY